MYLAKIDSSGWVFIYILLAILFIWILWEVIATASRGRKIWTEARKQTKLLQEIAKANGVAQETIEEITEPAQYKKIF